MADLSRDSVAEAIKNKSPDITKPNIEVGGSGNFLKDSFVKAVNFIADTRAELGKSLRDMAVTPGSGATSVERYNQKYPDNKI